jgi:predicted O-methyltransferase YrrM
MNEKLFEQVDQYIGNLLGHEDDALKTAIKAIDAAGIPQISVTANQGKFLQVLAKLVNAKKILEVGTLGGYSTIWMARALPANGKLITLEIDRAHADVALQNFKNAGVDDKIELRLGPALETLPALLQENAGPFDMIFIDADKPPYPEYFDWALKLSRPGTLIIADNVIREGKVLDENHPDDKVQGVHRLNKILSGNEKVTATILQTVGAKEHDGMAIAVVN